ncbi:MAG: Na/Pi cotransporter family protein [Ruminococcaceae bacterium]|nr:Na/Pi cotransporter family protein [Oscillospiraceae bacterium]
MGILDFVVFLGGVGLFLYGIKIMGQGLEMAAGSKLKSMLDKVTSNKFMAVLIGVIVTALIQSSSATTVMVVGFVNAGLMNLVQATGVIMGANIGTTVTSVLIALDLSEIAPIFVFGGAALLVFAKKKFLTHIGEIIAGFGLLFIGMDTMSTAMEPLRDSPFFIDLMVGAKENPMIGILVGLVFTAVIQSSSASIGILQALALKGLVPIEFAVFVLFGQNIGTCVTALLSAAGSKTNSKRAAVIHFLFNVLGTVIFVLISLFTPYVELLKMISDDTVVQISAAHIIFNVVSTLILFPFSNKIVALSRRLIPDKEDKLSKTPQLSYLDERILSTPPLAVKQAGNEVIRMAELAKENFIKAAKAFINIDDTELDEIENTEEVINFLNHSITPYLVKINNLDISEQDSEYISSLFHAVTDIERIGDHATNLAEATIYRRDNKPVLSEDAISELNIMIDNIEKLLDKSINIFKNQSATVEEAKAAVDLEEYIDDLHDEANDNHIKRMNKGKCDTKAGMLFINTITDFERVADHAINIAFYIPNPPQVAEEK